jgi:hypothetical protein
MTLNQSASTRDNMQFYNYDPIAGRIDAQIVDTMRSEQLGVTLAFTNCFPEGTTATSALVDVSFKAGGPGTVEFAGDDLQELTEAQIVWNKATVTLNEPVSVEVNPTTSQVIKGQTEQFTANVTNDNGSGVTWTVDGTDSSISPTGLLSVGSNETATTLNVTATSVKDNTKVDTVTVTVVDKPSLSVDMTQDKTKVFLGEASQVQFNATPSYSTGTTLTYSLSGELGSSTINPTTGLLDIAADETATTLTVKATANNSVADPVTADVTKTVELVEVDVKGVDPVAPTVERGFTQQFTAALENDLDNDGVTWTVDGTDSSIDPTGLLSVGANETQDTLTVTATSVKDTTKEATATITVIDELIISVTVDPTSATVTKGQTQNFTATVADQRQDLGVTWTVDGTDSTIDANGLLSVGANETASTLTVSATSVEDTTKSAQATVTVKEAPKVTISLDIANVDVKQGDKQVFSAITENDGGVGVTWEVLGATSADTKITPATGLRALTSSAELVVGADEKVGTVLTVKVTSKADTTKTATATIVVKAKDKAPVDPTNPTDPTKPTDPTNPTTPTDPVNNGKPSTQPTIVKPTTTTSSTNSGNGVKTADTTNAGLLAGYMGLSLIAFGALMVSRKRYNK